MSENCSFSLAHYKYCLELAKKRGYKFMKMSEFAIKNDKIPLSEKVIILRHDIDHTMRLIPFFLKIEKELGVPSTYFLRVHANYSLGSYENFGMISELIKGGYEIGLHHEGDFANLFSEDSDFFLKRNKLVLQYLINQEVLGVTLHAPAKSGISLSPELVKELGFLYDGYSDLFMKETKYISDSSSRWREGCMCNFIKNDSPRLTILTHPIWWFNRSITENY